MLATRFAVFNQNSPGDNIQAKENQINTSYSPTAHSEDVLYLLAMRSRRVPDNDVQGKSEARYWPQGALVMYNNVDHSTLVDLGS